MKRRILVVVALLALLALALPATVFAAETGTVSATVTAGTMAVTVSDGTVAYGTLPLNTTKNTAQYHATNNANGMATPQTQTITTSGGINVDLQLQTSIADIVTGTDWTLHATTPGTDTFTHGYNVASTAYTGGTAITFTNWTAVGTYVTVETVTDVTRYLELQIGMPVTATSPSEHTITVGIRVVQHGG